MVQKIKSFVCKKIFSNRKLKSCTRKKFYTIFFSLTSLFIMTMLFMHSSTYCFESGISPAIKKICDNYDNHKVRGDLCHDVCIERSLNEFHCGSGIYNDYRFVVARYGKRNEYIYLKQIKPNMDDAERLFWSDKNKKLIYPTKHEFSRLIQRTLFFNYNITLPSDKLARLLAFIDNSNGEVNPTYLETVWKFIHSNEYNIANLYESEELFPKIYGICGDYYAREFVEPLIKNVEGGEISLYEWKIRIKASILIVDFVEELNNYQTPLTICDVNVQYFSISDDRLKYHDPETIYPSEFIDRELTNHKKCSNDKHCSIQNCLGRCNPETKRCASKQLNNNLQIICDKVFKGTRYTPGILVTTYSSEKLLNILERCSNPIISADVDSDRPLGASKSLKDALYGELANIYEILSTKH